MALDVTTFIGDFPEFAQIDPGMLESYLAKGLEYVPADPWGRWEDQGHGYITAHLLALSPFGNGTALVNKDGTTIYEKHWKRLTRIVSGGFRSI